MLDWLQTMTVLERVLLYIAVPATLVLLIQTVLLFVGGAMDSDGGTDAGFDSTDTDGTFDPADTDTDGACHLDHASGDTGAETHDHAAGGLHIFTIRGVVAFLTLFAWGGLWLSQLGLRPFWAVFLAVEIGIAGMVGIALLMRQANRLQYDGTLDIRNAVGLSGTVYLTVPPCRTAPGKITLTVQEQLGEFEAVTDSAIPIPTGSPVQVTGLAEGDMLLVEPLTQTTI